MATKKVTKRVTKPTQKKKRTLQEQGLAILDELVAAGLVRVGNPKGKKGRNPKTAHWRRVQFLGTVTGHYDVRLHPAWPRFNWARLCLWADWHLVMVAQHSGEVWDVFNYDPTFDPDAKQA